jgi:major membrane immunogen (membrane-anchored lipoprotein)
MKRLFTFSLLLLFLASASFAQILTPVKWKFDVEKINDTEFKLKYTATIDKGWTVYSQFTSEDGPVPTSINYEEMSGIELVGKASEKGAKKEGMDAYFGVNVVKFLADKPFVIEQKIKTD